MLVTEIELQNKTIYTCEICKLGYADRQTADDCENFCKTHNACSLEITKKAVYKSLTDGEWQEGSPLFARQLAF